ncbi:RimK family alpha-L-glutamate ligase [Candidatus Woesebacteria bacterium]|nr:RimK family alpha-L-glutamate ligase [Candidatus Woesebacteria bacterium]
MSKTLWILSSKYAELFPLKEEKVQESIEIARKLGIPHRQLFFEDCVLDTHQEDSETPEKGDAMIVFISRAHFSKDKLLYVLQYFESRGVKLINSTQTIYTISDKWLTNVAAAAAGVPVPRTRLITTSKEFVSSELSDFSFPVVAKTPDGSLGLGVFWCETIEDLTDLVTFSAVQKPLVSSMLVQEAIVASKGSDVRVIILNGRILGAILRKNEAHGFKANIKQGGKATLYTVDKTLEKYTHTISKIFHLGFAGLDFLVDDDGKYFLTEVNADPGFAGFQSVHKDIRLSKELISELMK